MTNGNDLAFKDRGYAESEMELHYPSRGLSKREYFAAMAMQGMLVNNSAMNPDKPYENISYCAVAAADALINELNKTETK